MAKHPNARRERLDVSGSVFFRFGARSPPVLRDFPGERNGAREKKDARSAAGGNFSARLAVHFRTAPSQSREYFLGGGVIGRDAVFTFRPRSIARRENPKGGDVDLYFEISMEIFRTGVFTPFLYIFCWHGREITKNDPCCLAALTLVATRFEFV